MRLYCYFEYMATATLTKKISMERKIDMIFDYILKHKEHMFWNTLSEDEQKDLKKRQKETCISFDKVKKNLL